MIHLIHQPIVEGEYMSGSQKRCMFDLVTFVGQSSSHDNLGFWLLIFSVYQVKHQEGLDGGWNSR